MSKLLIIAGVVIGAVAGVLLFKRSRRYARTKAEEAKHRPEQESRTDENLQDQHDRRTGLLEEEALSSLEEEDLLRHPLPTIHATELRIESPEQRLAEENHTPEAVYQPEEESQRDAGRAEAEGLWKAADNVEHLEPERKECEEATQPTEVQQQNSEDHRRLAEVSDNSAEAPQGNAENEHVA